MTLIPSLPGRAPRFAVALAAIALVASLGACSSGSGSESGDASASATAAPSVDASLAALVPEDIRAAGTLTVGTDTTYAPVDFLAEDGKTIQGIDMDVLDAVAARLGLTVTYVSAPFDNIIPGVQSGKYDMGASAFTVNPEREEVVNMISYLTAGTQWATAAGNPKGVNPDDACGLVVAVQKGTVQVDDVEARSAACTDAGKAAITIDQYQGQDQATASVVSSKSDAMLADSPVVAYAVQQSGGKLEALGDIYDAAPYGWVVPKDQTDFAKALAGAAAAAAADGSYQAALEKWGATAGAVQSFDVNPSTD